MSAIYTGAIELRKLLVRFTRAPVGGTVEDAAIFTVHFAKLTGGAVDSNWLTADFTAVEGRFDTWWTAVKPNYPAHLSLAEYRWYKDGPVWSPDDRANGPTNPATRTTARAVAGTSSATVTLPPQAAMSVTKIVPIRKRWGRMFLPAPGSSSADLQGRVAVVAGVLSSFVTCFNGCRADGKQPVVWTRGRSEYTTVRGTLVPAHPASAYEITDLQMDNLFDVIRSRRWDTATTRTRTTLI